MSKAPVQARRPHPPRPCRPRSLASSTASSTRRSIAARRYFFPRPTTCCTGRAAITYGTKGTPTTEALEKAWTEVAGAAGTVLAPSGPRRRHGRAPVLPQGRRPPAHDGFGLPADAGVLRRLPRKFRCGDYLLRPADRRRHRRAAAARTRRLSLRRRRVRNPSRCRTSRRSPRSPHRHGAVVAHGQYLGDAAVLPAA